ncbi:type 11 methyltransferase [Bryobacterales bacterium F-183]|nr:type 11 methyltransferase [Bryobacterales bacterium F-183]
MCSMNAEEFRNIRKTEEQFWWFRGMREIVFLWLDPLLRKGSVERAAEAGCGTGGFALQFERRYSTTPLIALDLEPEGLQHAADMGLSHLVAGDIRALPFASGSLDLLLSLDVVVHLEKGREHLAFEEFMRVLKPGGSLLIRVSAMEALRSRHSEFTWERQRFSRQRLCEGLEQAGFQIERISYFNFFLSPVAWLKFRVWEPLTKAPPASGLEMPPAWLNRILEACLRLECRLSKYGVNFPFGQSLVCCATRKKVV